MLRTTIVFLALAVSASIAAGQSVDLVEVTPILEGDTLVVGHETVFDIYFNNDNPDYWKISGWACGFKFWSTGGTRSPVVIDSAHYFYQAEIVCDMDAGSYIKTFGDNGFGEDTIGVGAADMFDGMGLNYGMNVSMCRFSVTLYEDAVGEQFCLDSSCYPLCNSFAWFHASGPVYPAWDGPFCFPVVHCCRDIRGDFNYDGSINLVDLTSLGIYLFSGGEAPFCPEEANVDGDPLGGINIADVTYLVAYLFFEGSPPAVCP